MDNLLGVILKCHTKQSKFSNCQNDWERLPYLNSDNLRLIKLKTMQ